MTLVFICFLHLANVVYLFSYLVRDILWLRILTVGAIGLMIGYYFDNNLTVPIIWNLVFAAINLVQIGLLVRDRRPPKFTKEEWRLYDMVFRSIEPHELAKLFSQASWTNVPAGEQLIAEGAHLDRLMLLYSGSANVIAGGKQVAVLQAGHFLGEMSFLTGGETTAQVVAKESGRVVSWRKEDLRRLLGDRPQLQTAVHGVLGSDLVRKVCELRSRVSDSPLPLGSPSL